MYTATRLRKDGSWEFVKHEELKKGDVFTQQEGRGPRVWVAIEDHEAI